jgi:hypothetical protein
MDSRRLAVHSATILSFGIAIGLLVATPLIKKHSRSQPPQTNSIRRSGVSESADSIRVLRVAEQQQVDREEQLERLEQARQKQAQILHEQITDKLFQESKRIEAVLISKARQGYLDRGLGMLTADGATGIERTENALARIGDLRREGLNFAADGNIVEARQRFEEIHRYINGLHDSEFAFRRKAASIGVVFAEPPIAEALGKQTFDERIELERQYQRILHY